MAEFIYTLSKARKAHGDKVVLDDVTLSFLPGAKIGVVGPNGAGKSSLLKIMAGMDDVSNGDAKLHEGFTVGFLQQEPKLDETKTVLENVQDGVDECRECWVDREKLEELKELCESVLLAPANAEKELPRKSGFFFGSTEYSDGYYADLKDTIEIVDRCLSIPEEWEFSYQSSW